jgi:hypothetical protein
MTDQLFGFAVKVWPSAVEPVIPGESRIGKTTAVLSETGVFGCLARIVSPTSAPTRVYAAAVEIGLHCAPVDEHRPHTVLLLTGFVVSVFPCSGTPVTVGGGGSAFARPASPHEANTTDNVSIAADENRLAPHRPDINHPS